MANETGSGPVKPVFRIADAADGPRLIEMINAAFMVEAFVGGTRTDAERLARSMETGEILLAEDGAGRMLGSVYMERKGRRGFLGMLAVDPAEQRRGVARMLLREAEGRFRAEGLEAVDIMVLNLRPELLPVYKRMGYEVQERKEVKLGRPLKDGLECWGLVMRKVLGTSI